MTSLKKKNNVAAVIPFYNERRTINEVVSKTLKYVDKVFAVNDGSTDHSCDQVPDQDNITLIRFESNKGKGSALNAGLMQAEQNGYDIILTIDSDLQHDPEEIPLLLKEIEKYDIVIGNRLNDLSTMPLQRRMSNRITSYLLSRKTGQKLLDSQCGFRAYHSTVIKNVKTEYSGYEAESEILIKASRKNYKIGFADISTIYGEEKSKMNSLKTTFGFIKILFI